MRPGPRLNYDVNIGPNPGPRDVKKSEPDLKKNCRKEHESMDPSCLVSTVQAAGNGAMVRGIFYWHTLGSMLVLLLFSSPHSFSVGFRS